MNYRHVFFVFTISALLLTGCAARSPLLVAASKGDINSVQNLIKNGADIEQKDKAGYTALFLAVCDGQSSIVEYLINKGAKIDTQNGEGMTPLHYAALHLTPQTSNNVITILLDNGADASIKDKYGNTPLKYAMTYNLDNLVIIRSKYDGTDEDISLSFADALRSPSRINPEASSFIIPSGKGKAYTNAVNDCNYLVVPYKSGVLWVTGPIGYAASLAFDAATVPGKFQRCMEKMGFKYGNNCSR